MITVLDTNVVVSGIFWATPSRRCLVSWAHRRYQLAVTDYLLAEYEFTAHRMSKNGLTPNWRNWIEWISRKGKRFVPYPLGKQRSRDPKDDMFLACALASGASYIVSKDKDLLSMEKPFGIEVVPPEEFLKRLDA